METQVVNGKIGKLCKYFANNGFCFYGESCQFVHAKGKVESTATVDDSVITSSGGAAALMPRVANVPRQLKYGESRSTPSSPKKNQNLQNIARPFPNPEVTAPFQQLNLDSPQFQALHFQQPNPNLAQPFLDLAEKESPSFFISQQIKVELQRQQAISHAPPTDENLPVAVDSYHSLCALEDSNINQQTGMLRCISTCYKAVSSKDGQVYCLRRIHGYRLVNPKAFAVIEKWKEIKCTNIVPLVEVFTTKAFGDNSLIFVYEFFPGAKTLMERHFSPAATAPFQQGNRGNHNPLWTPKHKYAVPVPAQRALPERLLWNYVIQLTGAIRRVHGADLACRAIDPTKILLIGNSRLRINCIGILDVLTNDASSKAPVNIQHYQQEDLLSLGQIILALSCYSIDAVHAENIQHSLEFVAKNYSSDLKGLIWHLLTSQPQNHSPKSINDVMPIIGARFYNQLDTMQGRNDILERELSKV